MGTDETQINNICENLCEPVARTLAASAPWRSNPHLSVGVVKGRAFMPLHEVMQGGQDAARLRHQRVRRQTTGVGGVDAFDHAGQFVAKLLERQRRIIFSAH